MELLQRNSTRDKYVGNSGRDGLSFAEIGENRRISPRPRRSLVRGTLLPATAGQSGTGPRPCPADMATRPARAGGGQSAGQYVGQYAGQSAGRRCRGSAAGRRRHPEREGGTGRKPDRCRTCSGRPGRSHRHSSAAEARADSERKKTEAVEADRDMAIATANRLTVEIAAMRRSDALRRAAGLAGAPHEGMARRIR